MTEDNEPSINVENQKYKMIFVGDQGTGKTCILNRFATNQFDEQYQTTIGLDFQSKNVSIHDQDVRLLLYDTAGQEKFRSLIPMYIRESNIILLVYDITRKESFDNIPRWFSDVLNIKSNEAIYVLVGNKIDLKDQRKVTYNEGKKLADEKNIIFEEVSAKTGENFEELFRDKIYESIYRKYKNEFEKRNYLNGDELVVNLDDEENKNKIKIDKNNFKKKSSKKSFCC
jgi:Ras-related protein Rab-6A